MQSVVAEMERGRWQPCLDVINAAETDPIYLRGRGVESLTRESKVGGGAETEGTYPRLDMRDFKHVIMFVSM